MSLTFLTPLFLAGALAAAIPLLIHLSRSRRTKTMRFSTTRFFTDQFLRSYRTSRLKELLLLACRMALVAVNVPSDESNPPTLDESLPDRFPEIADEPDAGKRTLAGLRKLLPNHPAELVQHVNDPARAVDVAAGRDLRYEVLARRRKEALQKLRGAFGDVDPTAASISRARDLPPEMRQELLQGHDEGYPAGYENLLKNYYKKLSGEK